MKENAWTARIDGGLEDFVPETAGVDVAFDMLPAARGLYERKKGYERKRGHDGKGKRS